MLINGKNIIEFWRNNPSVACSDLLFNPLSNEEGDHFTLVAPQRIVVDRIWKARSAIVVACRGFGKTRIAATLAILQAWLYPGRRVGCLSASFRQSKQIFEEIQKIWNRSDLLKECTLRHPVISNDACRLDFKAVPGYDSSTIRALPLADGNKIRGARFHSMLLDEACQIPESVFQLVLRPMAATHQDPVHSMRIEREKDRIRSLGLSSEEEEKQIKGLEQFVGANQIFMFTSGYYSFNYVYDLYLKYSNRMNGKFEATNDGETEYPEDYATFQIPHTATPKGFLDPRALRDARRDMSALQFRMEYEAAWILDTGGFFKASDVDGCRSHRLVEDGYLQSPHYVQRRGHPGKYYVMGVDPARTSDAFAIVISEFDPHFGMKVAFVEQFFNEPIPKMVRRIFELTNLFNIIEIGIDKGGGGHQTADYLAEGSDEEGVPPLFDMDEIRYRGMRGRHIIKLINFSSTWIEQANNDAYNMLQRRQMCFPSPPLGADTKDSKERDNVQSIIERMITQLLQIEPSQTRLSGRIRFDLPETGGGFEQHKDLYSAWLISSHLCYTKLMAEAIPQKKMPLLGIVVPRAESTPWY